MATLEQLKAELKVAERIALDMASTEMQAIYKARIKKLQREIAAMEKSSK